MVTITAMAATITRLLAMAHSSARRRSRSDYDNIHVIPTDAARASVLSFFASVSAGAAATTATAHSLYGQVHDCLDMLGYEVNVRSWSAIWQQLHCHLVFKLFGGGASWDLEGNRASDRWGYLFDFPPCNG